MHRIEVEFESSSILYNVNSTYIVINETINIDVVQNNLRIVRNSDNFIITGTVHESGINLRALVVRIFLLESSEYGDNSSYLHLSSPYSILINDDIIYNKFKDTKYRKKVYLQIGINSELIINENEWYFLVGVWDGNEMKIYLNGKLENSKAVSAVIGNFDSDLFIGTYGGETERYAFKGIIDDIAIFNKPLSSTEIEQIYYATK